MQTHQRRSRGSPVRTLIVFLPIFQIGPKTFDLMRLSVLMIQKPPDELNIYVLQQQNLGRRFGTSKMHFSTPVAAVCSKAVVLLLLIRCCKGFCNVLYFVTLCPILFCNHLDGDERGLAALLSLSSWCLVIIVWLFLSMPWVLSAVCDCVIPNHIHLLFLGVIHANSDGFGESAHLLGLVGAFVTIQNSHVVAQMTIECHFVRAAKGLISLTFAQAYLSLRHCTKSHVLPKMAMCFIHASSEYSGKSAHLPRRSHWTMR